MRSARGEPAGRDAGEQRAQRKSAGERPAAPRPPPRRAGVAGAAGSSTPLTAVHGRYPEITVPKNAQPANDPNDGACS